MASAKEPSHRHQATTFVLAATRLTQGRGEDGAAFVVAGGFAVLGLPAALTLLGG
ncbi:hypothetical protein ACFLIM_15340 [Nonomuraea sp. M3C6]|uniref:MFS transporter n=1 Tax=Nonomuraea marmarensis TaxID=3351344 RepID=A0ABW7ABR9_9ACTN